MNLIIVGCGRIGSELAKSTALQGHQITVIDRSTESFERLGMDFPGRTVSGDVLDQDVFHRADIEQADGLAAVTSDDATNFVVARAAKEVFHVPNVVVRAYDPRRRDAFENLGIRSVATSLWGARRLTQLLTHPGYLPVMTFGHAEITLVETVLSPKFAGKTLAALQEPGERYAVALIRGGNGFLPEPDFVVQANDRVIFSVLSDQISGLDDLKEKEKEG
jgi:trk system potassium uptake protein TrkA